jgi:pyruvate dehydrogenase E1 component
MMLRRSPGAKAPRTDAMITEAHPIERSSTALERVTYRAFAQMQAMIHAANTRKDKRPGDPKVGGHPASCASSMHILAALHLVVREPEDYVCCKPHASPVDHALHSLMGLFRHGADGAWFGEDEAKAAMTRLRKFPTPGAEAVFQSYHAKSDPDSFHFFPSGSVGIPPVVSVYVALAYRYARDHDWEVPENAHFWSLIGDSEFREGSLLEAMPDVAERQLGNVTWIIDYNRQNLDGTRIPNERGLQGADCDRIERTALANGWRVIQVRHGAFRAEVFARPGGAALQRVIEKGLTDYEYQMLALSRSPRAARETFIGKDAACAQALEALSDDDVVRLLLDLGGHCTERMIDALARSRAEPDAPYLVIAHTLKGWGLACLADPSNHSTLLKREEVEALLERAGLSPDDPFAWFPEDSAEGRLLAERRARFRAGWDAHNELRAKNLARVDAAIAAGGGIPASLDIDLKLFPLAHTQWMWGQLATKLVRIGTHGTADGDEAQLTNAERPWRSAAEFVLTLSPDVGTSTNISPAIDARVYGPEGNDPDLDERLELKVRHPEMVATQDVWTRHIRFEIAEANAMSAVGSFGKMADYVGLPMFPIMTVYDFFIKRALDQLYYDLYWGAEFVIMGTPSGVTLSPEGAQHSWKSDIQIPNLITWEPLFAIEVDWILSDAIRRHMLNDNDGRTGVLIRAVTRGVKQALLLENVRRHARSKVVVPGPLEPADAGWGQGQDESTVASLPDDELLARVRADCLAGAFKLVDWEGYAGYAPGDNVVNVFAMGAVLTEALDASLALLARGVFANVIAVSSPELLVGILGEADDYRHLREGLGVDGDLIAVRGAEVDAAGLVSVAGRRVPCVAVCDGEAGLLDNIGSVLGVKQRTLAVRRFSKCGRPDEVYAFQGIDGDAIVAECGRVLSETALEDLRVPPALLEELAGRAPAPRDWRALWPDPPAGA